MRPEDECPYEKPFPANFSTCPAFAPRTYIALDLQYRPLPPVWTCNHLKMSRGAAGGGFYASCALGDEAARAVHALSQQSERVDLLKRMRAGSVAASTPLLEEMWTIKGRSMMATKKGDREAARTAAEDLAVLALRFGEVIDADVATYSEELAQAGMEVEAVRLMSRSWLDQMVATTTTINNWTVPEEILARFPEDVRALLRGDTSAGQVSQSPERDS